MDRSSSVFPELTHLAEPPSHAEHSVFTKDQLVFMSRLFTPQKGSPKERGKGSVTGLGCPNVNTRKKVMREKAKGRKCTRNEKETAGYAVVMRQWRKSYLLEKCGT